MKGKTAAIVIVVIVIIAVAAVAALTMTGRPAGPAAGAPKELKVGVLLPGTVTDFGWDYAPQLAMTDLKASKLPIPITANKFVELVDPAGTEGAIRDLMSVGYNWIWAWGFQYAEAVQAVAKTAPSGVYFLINEGVPANAIKGQVEIIDEYEQQTAYLAGIIGGSMSITKKVGVISGSESLQIVEGEAGFKAGANAWDSAITFDHVYVGNWGDPQGGRTLAESLIAKGVDVIYCQGDGTSLGVIEAVKAARDQGKQIFYIGYPVDQSVVAAGNVLTSVVYNYTPDLTAMVQDIASGNYGSGKYQMTLGSGMELALFYNFDSQVPQKAKDMVAQARVDILAGKITVPTTL